MNLSSVPSEWFNYCIAFVFGFATCLVVSLRKQPIQNLQALNWKSGDLLKFTFGPQENLEGATKGAKLLSSSEEKGVINALLIDWIKRDPSTSTAVADLSRLSSNLKDAGLSEPLALKFIEGDLNYLISNIVIYRQLAKRLASCTRGSQLLQQMQLGMYAYCWLYGPQAKYYTRAFDIARRIDAFKDRWALIPGEILESITHAIDNNSDPLTRAIDPGLPAVLDDIYDNPAIHDDQRELWDNISSDFYLIMADLDSYKR